MQCTIYIFLVNKLELYSKCGLFEFRLAFDAIIEDSNRIGMLNNCHDLL
jgi:hypothetical protein